MNSKKLAIAQIVLGLLVVGSFFAFINWVFDGYYVYEGTIPDSDVGVRVLLNPNPAIPNLVKIWQFVYLGLGVVVIGCGIAQFIKLIREEIG